MKELTEEQKKLLKKTLPADAVKEHPTRRGMSTIKAIYVTERLNEVFGVGAWQLRVEPLTVSDTGLPYLIKTYETSNKKERTEYFAVSKTTLTIPEYNIHYECVAGASNDDLGDAMKGAQTDAVTKIASWIGIGIDVFKGQHDDAVRQEQQQEAADLAADVKAAIKKLADCNSVVDLTNLKKSLTQQVLANKEFVDKATARYNEIKPAQ